jgi:hypothetical protein
LMRIKRQAAEERFVLRVKGRTRFAAPTFVDLGRCKFQSQLKPRQKDRRTGAAFYDFMDIKDDEEIVTELWGCGFNQFCQIDESGDNVRELTRIDLLSSKALFDHDDGIKIVWAGWADLICNLIPAWTLAS